MSSCFSSMYVSALFSTIMPNKFPVEVCFSCSSNTFYILSFNRSIFMCR
uniref:Uncharacterized protein n=1 Tax=Arundo donax TaxID=35708 RepID=A0A0A9H5N2_ARUDO